MKTQVTALPVRVVFVPLDEAGRARLRQAVAVASAAVLRHMIAEGEIPTPGNPPAGTQDSPGGTESKLQADCTPWQSAEAPISTSLQCGQAAAPAAVAAAMTAMPPRPVQDGRGPQTRNTTASAVRKGCPQPSDPDASSEACTSPRPERGRPARKGALHAND